MKHLLALFLIVPAIAFGQASFKRNYYTTNQNPNAIVATNVNTTNITTITLFSTTNNLGDLTVTNGITNLSLTANTALKADANKMITSIPGGYGALTNNGAGLFGWDPFTNLASITITQFHGKTTFITTNYTTNFFGTTNFLGDVTITNGLTNLSLTPNTVLKADANKRIASIPNGIGALTNNGLGGFGWGTAVIVGDGIWTNEALGTAIGTIGVLHPLATTNVWFQTNGASLGWNGFAYNLPAYAPVEGNFLFAQTPTQLQWTNNIQNLIVSNAIFTNITVETIYVITNFGDNITITNGITNLSLTANTVLKADANKQITSIANGTGSLTNDGAGVFGWSANPTYTNVFVETNNAGWIILTNGMVIAEASWGGPTNFVLCGLTNRYYYIANTPCAITNLVAWLSSGFENHAVLEITNASSSNITITVHTPIRIPVEDASRSYTLTNGNVMACSLEVATMGSNSVLRAFKP